MSRAAVRYAKAVLSLAQDKNATSDVHKDMTTIADTVDASKDLKLMLASPLVKNEIKLASLNYPNLENSDNLELKPSTEGAPSENYSFVVENTGM